MPKDIAHKCYNPHCVSLRQDKKYGNGYRMFTWNKRVKSYVCSRCKTELELEAEYKVFVRMVEEYITSLAGAYSG